MTDSTIFFHGWGYNPLFWQSHIEQYKNTHILCYNRGYFGDYYKPNLGIGKNRCVTHSTGLFFVTQEYNLSDFDEVIIYAGFDIFPSKTAVKAMRIGLQKTPDKILNDFYNACGFIPCLLEKPNINRLADDLKMLEILDISKQLQDINYTAYHGGNDTIITEPLKGAIMIANTGHLCNLI